MIDVVASPPPALWRGDALTRVGPALWRVAADGGLIVGHLAVTEEGRYEVRRFHPAARTFVPLGAFWSAPDALETLHHSR